MSENTPEPANGEPGTVDAPDLGIPGEAEPPREEEPTDDGPDSLGDAVEETADDAPVEVDPGEAK